MFTAAKRLTILPCITHQHVVHARKGALFDPFSDGRVHKVACGSRFQTPLAVHADGMYLQVVNTVWVQSSNLVMARRLKEKAVQMSESTETSLTERVEVLTADTVAVSLNREELPAVLAFRYKLQLILYLSTGRSDRGSCHVTFRLYVPLAFGTSGPSVRFFGDCGGFGFLLSWNSLETTE